LGIGNLRANGHPSGGPWRQFQCRACEGYFLETHGTLFHGTRVAVELIVRVLACLAEGLGIRATARVFEVAPNTVLHWLVEAAEHLRAFSAYFLCDLHVGQLQLDELYAVLRGVKAGEISEENALKRLEHARHWVWTAIDPESKLLLAIDIGPRTLAMAQRVVHQVVQVLAPGCVPLFLTVGFKEYATALLAHCGEWVQPPRRQATGPAPKPGGCLCRSCSMRRWSRPCANGGWSTSSIGWCSGRVRQSGRYWLPAAGRSIRPLWRGSTWISASA
jgi:hypothetical protein